MFVERALDDGDMGKALGYRFFNQVFDQKPGIPFAFETAFPWVANAQASMSSVEILISLESREFTVGKHTGTLHQSATIFTEDVTDPDGTHYSAGDVTYDANPLLIIDDCMEFDAPAADLTSIAEVIITAARALHAGSKEAGK